MTAKCSAQLIPWSSTGDLCYWNLSIQHLPRYSLNFARRERVRILQYTSDYRRMM